MSTPTLPTINGQDMSKLVIPTDQKPYAIPVGPTAERQLVASLTNFNKCIQGNPATGAPPQPTLGYAVLFHYQPVSGLAQMAMRCCVSKNAVMSDADDALMLHDIITPFGNGEGTLPTAQYEAAGLALGFVKPGK